MATIKLDFNKLLGFRLVAADQAQTATLSAKIGTKDGPGPVGPVALSAKVGGKVGGKTT